MALRSFGIVAMAMSLVVGSCWGRCPSKAESLVLDANEFEGDWYLVAASPPVGNRVANCSGMSISIQGLANIKGAYCEISFQDGRPHSYFVEVQNNNDFGTWRVGGTQIQGSFKHRTLAAAYEDYMAFVICPEDEQKPNFQIFGLIFSRSKTLSAPVLNELKNKVGVYVDVKNIHNLQHDRCELSTE